MKLLCRDRGFTLIELLVVLAIVGSLGSMVAPKMWSSLQRASERDEVMSFVNELKSLRHQAYFSGESLRYSEDEFVAGDIGENTPEFPAGWIVIKQTSLFFLPTGVTSGGSIHLTSPSGRNWVVHIEPLGGRMSIEGLR